MAQTPLPMRTWSSGSTAAPPAGSACTSQASLTIPRRAGFALSPLVANTWQQVTIPLSSLNVANSTSFTGLWIQDASGTAQATFYVDDIALTTVPTPGTVTISVNAAGTLAPIDPRLFGINTAVWDRSFDTQTTRDLLNEMGTLALRFPGGSVVR